VERDPDPIEEDFGEEWTPPLAPAVRGRGAAENPANRFERLHVEPDPEREAEREAERRGAGEGPGTGRGLRTVYLRDASRSVLSRNDSPDVGYRVG